MSKRIINVTVIFCLLFAAPSFGSRVVSKFGSEFSVNGVSLTLFAKSIQHHELTSEYNTYPSARRPELTQHLLNKSLRK